MSGSIGDGGGTRPPASKVEDAVREGLRKLWRDESAAHERRDGVYYPSYLGYCLRKQYYIYSMGEEPTSDKLAVFATGKGVHEAVAEALRASGTVVVEEVEKDVKVDLGNGISLSGRVDLILAEVEGRNVVVEVKSASRLPDSPQEHHLLQLQIYLNALNVDDGVLLYWDKRRGRLASFDVRRDGEYMRRAAERALLLHEYLGRGMPPPREAVMEGRLWECDMCEYRRLCRPFLLEGLPEGERVMISEVDGVLVDDSRRVEDALVNAGVPPGSYPWRLRPELRSRFLDKYYDPRSLALDARGPFLDYVWRSRAGGVRLILVSRRPERLRRATEEELRSMGLIWDYMLLSPDGADGDWKGRVLARLSENYRVEEVLDREGSVLRIARRMGARTPFDRAGRERAQARVRQGNINRFLMLSPLASDPVNLRSGGTGRGRPATAREQYICPGTSPSRTAASTQRPRRLSSPA